MRFLAWFFLKICSWLTWRPRSSHRHERKPQRVLVGTNAAIGDAIMALPTIDALKSIFPEMDVWASPATAPFFERRGLRHVWILPDHFIGILKMILRIRKERYDVFIGCLTANTFRQCAIPFFGSIPRRYKHASPHRGSRNYDFVFTRCIPLDMRLHRVTCNLQLLDAVNQPSGQEWPSIEVLPNDASEAERCLRMAGIDLTRPLAACHPGCNPKAWAKRWPEDRFVSLLCRLMKDTGTQFVLLGGPEETELTGRIGLQCGSGVVSLAGKTSLMVTAAILKRCQYLITNDSGIMHLGTAVGTPVVAIFGPTRESHIGPTGRQSVVIRKGPRVEDVDVASVIVSIERLRALQTDAR